MNTPAKYGAGRRLSGKNRYLELLSRDLVRFLQVNLLTILCLLPLLLAVDYAIVTRSVLVLLCLCIPSGIPAGAGITGMYDCVLRSLRDAPGGMWENYKKAWKQNFKGAILPGIVFSLVVGFYGFVLFVLGLGEIANGKLFYALYLVGIFLFSLIYTVLWPMYTLFALKPSDFFRNQLLFTVRYFFRVIGTSLLNLGYWVLMLLLVPYSLVLMPFFGFWFIIFSSSFLLYDSMNEMFQIEESIADLYPDQVPFYETDEEWLERKQRENETTEAETESSPKV